MSKGIIGAGNWIMDKVKMIDRWPQEGELCNIVTQQMGGGGGPCNILFDIAAMQCGIPLYACGVVGKDADGDLLLRQIKEKSIDRGFMSISETQPTSFTDVMTVIRNGRRTFFHNRGANAEFNFSHIENIDTDAKIFYLGYLLLLDGMDQEDPEFGTVAARVLSCMKEKGCKTVVDVVSEDRPKFQKIVPPSLKYTDCLVINEVEAECCSDIAVRNEAGEININALIDAAKHLLDSGVNELVVIHFPEGAVVVEKDGTVNAMESYPMEREDIVGSVGAGDAFCAGVVYGLHEGLSITDMLKMASVSAFFNLQSATATAGAPEISKLKAVIDAYEFKQLEYNK